jgi:hypothetical protein
MRGGLVVRGLYEHRHENAIKSTKLKPVPSRGRWIRPDKQGKTPVKARTRKEGRGMQACERAPKEKSQDRIRKRRDARLG